MNIKQLLSNFNILIKNLLVATAQKTKENIVGYSLLNYEVYYNKSTFQFYFKIVTDTGFICADITIDELFLKSHIVERLDQKSCNYVHYIRGRLEERANLGETSIFTFLGESPFETDVIFVTSLIDNSTIKWNIVEAYTKQWYLNLDKPSIGKFIEKYCRFKILYDTTTPKHIKLKLVK